METWKCDGGWSCLSASQPSRSADQYRSIISIFAYKWPFQMPTSIGAVTWCTTFLNSREKCTSILGKQRSFGSKNIHYCPLLLGNTGLQTVQRKNQKKPNNLRAQSARHSKLLRLPRLRVDSGPCIVIHWPSQELLANTQVFWWILENIPAIKHLWRRRLEDPVSRGPRIYLGSNRPQACQIFPITGIDRYQMCTGRSWELED